MDVNPLLAVFFKLASPLLPHTFQYFGLECGLACGLQLFFALRLFRLLLGRNGIAILLPSLFFLISPPLVLRMVGHYALTNQWLLTAALFVFCLAHWGRSVSLAKLLAMTLVLGGISVAINPYIAFQVLLVLVAAVIALGLNHRLTWPATSGLLAALGAIAGGAAYVFGFVIPGGQGYGADGYREYSMNLLSPFDPNAFGSLFSRQLPLFVHDQYEGYCYFGAGVILLAAVMAVIACLRPARLPKFQWRSAAPFLICCFVLTLMALSTRITFGSHLVVDLDPNQKLTPFLAPFRSSGRMFWAPYYAALATVLVLPFFYLKRRWASLLVALALIIQFADTVPLRRSVQSAAKNQSSPTALKSPIWSKLGSRYQNLVVMPPFQCSSVASPGGEEGADIFGLLAAAQGMRINSYRSGRLTGVSAKFHCEESIAALKHPPLSLSPASVYVVSRGMASIIAAGGGKCHAVDGFVLCSAKDDFGLAPDRWDSPTRFWVRSHFRTILMRDPTKQELTKWTKELDERTEAPADFLLQLLTSAEFERRSIPTFWTYLDKQGRWPTRAEWLSADQPAMARMPYRAGLPHDHDRAVLQMLYFAILERDPDPLGLKSWTETMSRHPSTRDLILGFLGSAEYKAHGYDY